jgi:hypothetical protein
MPGTQAQNVTWVALDEQFPPARTGVPLGLALALTLALELELELELALAAGVVLLDELDPPLLQAASAVITAVPTSAVTASRFILSLPGLLFDNMPGLLHVGAWGSAFDRRLKEGERLRWKGQDDGAALGGLR